jgi:hypothetical protein
VFATANPELTIALVGVRTMPSSTPTSPLGLVPSTTSAGPSAAAAGGGGPSAAAVVMVQEVVTSTGKIQLRTSIDRGLVVSAKESSSSSDIANSGSSMHRPGDSDTGVERSRGQVPEMVGDFPGDVQPLRRRDFLRDLVAMKRQSQVIYYDADHS